MLLCTHPSNFSILHSNWVTAIQSICLLLVVYKMKYDSLKKILFVSNNLQACCCSRFLYENLNVSCCLCQPISEPSPFLGGSVNYITSHCSLGMCALPCWGLFSLASQICSNMFFCFFSPSLEMLLSYLGHVQLFVFLLVRCITSHNNVLGYYYNE